MSNVKCPVPQTMTAPMSNPSPPNDVDSNSASIETLPLLRNVVSMDVAGCQICLPLVIVYEIVSYLGWKHCARLITKEWLFLHLQRKVKLRRWRSKVRMYSYIKVFGQSACSQSWHRFCLLTLQVQCRARNKHYRLTWKAAADNYFRKRCRGCGCKSKANVFGEVICQVCRFDPRLPQCLMVSVAKAISLGVPKRVLHTIPWHGSAMGHRLRFWKEITLQLNVEL